jgi:hypothetical protein
MRMNEKEMLEKLRTTLLEAWYLSFQLREETSTKKSKKTFDAWADKLMILGDEVKTKLK